MSGTDRVARLARLALVGLLLAGCATSSAPAAFLPLPAGAGQSARGGWLDAALWPDSGKAPVALRGELIAITTDSVWIQPYGSASPIGDGLVVGRKHLTGLLTRYNWHDTQTAISGFTTLGAIGSISNGFFAVLTIPSWIIAGSAGGAVDSHRAHTDLVERSEQSETELKAFSRFPL